MKHKAKFHPKCVLLNSKHRTAHLTNFVETQARIMCGLNINPPFPFHWHKYIMLSISDCKPSCENNQPFPESLTCLILKSCTWILQNVFSMQKHFTLWHLFKVGVQQPLSVHWGIKPLSNTPPPLFCQAHS